MKNISTEARRDDHVLERSRRATSRRDDGYRDRRSGRRASREYMDHGRALGGAACTGTASCSARRSPVGTAVQWVRKPETVTALDRGG